MIFAEENNNSEGATVVSEPELPASSKAPS